MVLVRPLTMVASTWCGPVRTFGSLDQRGAVIVEETVLMAHRIRSAWTFVMAVAPIAAIALVEGALRRWS